MATTWPYTAPFGAMASLRSLFRESEKVMLPLEGWGGHLKYIYLDFGFHLLDLSTFGFFISQIAFSEFYTFPFYKVGVPSIYGRSPYIASEVTTKQKVFIGIPKILQQVKISYLVLAIESCMMAGGWLR